MIGIDPGASNSAATILGGGLPVMILNAEGITWGGAALVFNRRVASAAALSLRLARA